MTAVTLGCNKNQDDSEVLFAGLSDNFVITIKLYEVEIIILNTFDFFRISERRSKRLYKITFKSLKIINVNVLF